MAQREGGRKMFERLRPIFYWPTMLNDCEKFRQRCLVCKQHEEMSRSAGLLDPTTSDKIGDKHIVFLDFAGPLPVTSRGNKYVLVGVDEKGWPWLSATKDMESATVMEAYRQQGIREYGIPDLAVTDNARSFTAEVLKSLFKALGVEKVTTTAYHPQSNWAETMVKASKRVIARLATEYKKEWDETLAQAQLALLSWNKSPYGMSPYKMRTGRDLSLASAFENPMYVQASPTAEKMKAIDAVIKTARDEAAEKMKEEYDARHEERKFKVGDQVWWREHEPANKLEPKRSGPYEIARVISDLNYELAELPQGPKIGTRKRMVHVQHLEEFNVDGGEEKEDEVEELTRFASGEEWWLTDKELIDKEGDSYVINEELKNYWARTPSLRPWIGKYLS